MYNMHLFVLIRFCSRSCFLCIYVYVYVYIYIYIYISPYDIHRHKGHKGIISFKTKSLWFPHLDHILRGQELLWVPFWVQRFLCRPDVPHQTLPLHSGGKWQLHDLWKTLLQWQPVLPEERRLSWLPLLDGDQRLCQLLSPHIHGELLFLGKAKNPYTKQD